MEVMSLKSFIGGIHPKDQKQYTMTLKKNLTGISQVYWK